ncbi:MBL fold metallo-hydrolase [Balneolaceae bacterium YR4-1]|uniref:MBL fold metallo-hydrolase n=1 Tax=Halalkalibaculum roseum TaxID=2709311 RepID=A0A6M1SSN5_9BACT|nr:MBL fold metallo-hydrolase [Halalkalibaculum roseum]NGP75880.1 MBL fold metallo-hydrolase [Halalkalibaculum roseum]
MKENDIICHPLYEGTFSVGLDKKFNRIDRDDPPAKGALKISLNPFLITGQNRNYLFDVGIGDFGEDTNTDTIKENLAKFGLTEYDITDIFASHLHYDHIGGLAGKGSGYWELTFPEAKLWVSGNGWQKVLNQDEYYDEEKSEFIHFLDAKADIEFLEDTDHPYDDVSINKIGGHTEFSQVLLYDDGEHKYLMAGDVLATRGEVNRNFAAKYDFDAKESMKMRKELTRKAYEEDFTILGYHDSHHPLFQLTDHDKEKGYSIKNIDSNVPA